MRRAIGVLSAVVLLASTGTVAPARAQSVINAIGLIDYASKPTFKVGDWARYEMSGRSELGMSDEYTLTLLIAGEEDFWGDPGFWVETWVDMPGQPPRTRASLVSYSIFRDSSAIQRLLLYTRKMISMLNEDGTPKIDINKPASSTLKARHEVKNPVNWSREELGADTVTIRGRTVTVNKVLLRQGKGVTSAVGDSTVYTELREDRTSWYTDEVPITHLAREDIVTTSSRKAWLVGRSGDATPLAIRDRGVGSATLIDYGHGGLEARMVPHHLRKSLTAQRAATRAAAVPPAAKKR
jgi:hypothetical protein